MVQSALLGEPPATDDDVLIQIGLKESVGSIYNPNPLYPYGPPKPIPDLSWQSNSYKLLVTEVVCLILIICVTLGRFWIRSRQQSWSFGLDDLMVIPACACGIAYISAGTSEVVGSCLGKHMWFCTYEQLQTLALITTVLSVVFYFGVYCAKLSIIFFVRRITAFTTPGWKITHWILFAVVLSCGLISVFCTAFPCIPVAPHYSFVALAKTDLKNLRCVNYDELQLGLRGLHIGTDLILLAFPLIILYRLQMSTRKKIGIGWVFCFGVVCCVSSIMRSVGYEHPPVDLTYDGYSPPIWDTVDFSFAIMVASLPVYYRVFIAVFGPITRMIDFTGSRRHTNNKRSSSSIIDRLTRSKVNKSEAPNWPLEVVNPQPTHSRVIGSVDSGRDVLLASSAITARDYESKICDMCPENMV